MKKVLLTIFVLVVCLFAMTHFVWAADPLSSPPKGWLSTLVPEGVLQIQTNFLETRLVPFLISLMLFLIIVLSLIFTIVGGIMYSVSGGNKEGLAKAKNTITYALIGLALGLSSMIIVGILGQFMGIKLLTP